MRKNNSVLSDLLVQSHDPVLIKIHQESIADSDFCNIIKRVISKRVAHINENGPLKTKVSTRDVCFAIAYRRPKCTTRIFNYHKINWISHYMIFIQGA